MKKLLIIATAFTLAASALQAQDNNAVSGSASQANNSANQVSASGAIAAGGNVTFNEAAQPKPLAKTTIKQDGTATLKTAPSLGGLALGGGHPCAYSPATAQISIIGGGFGAGGMTLDEACMLLVMAASAGDPQAYAAAKYMMAARDKEACLAMYKAGMVEDCVNKRGKSLVKKDPVVSTSNYTGATKQVALEVECRQVGNKITPVTSRKVMDTYGAAAVKAACM